MHPDRIKACPERANNNVWPARGVDMAIETGAHESTTQYHALKKEVDGTIASDRSPRATKSELVAFYSEVGDAHGSGADQVAVHLDISRSDVDAIEAVRRSRIRNRS